MDENLRKEFGEAKCREWNNKLEKGQYSEVENEVNNLKKAEVAQVMETLITSMSYGKNGHQLAKKLKKYNLGKAMTRRFKEIVLGLGQRIRVGSWYAWKKGKKKGPYKPGPNGRGKHLLLAYWGFWKKYSPRYVNHVVRAGVAAAAYDLAEEDLRDRGYKITSNQIDRLVQDVGEKVLEHRETILLESDEDMVGKRVMIAVDGGRVRTRQLKTGRYQKGQKAAKFDTDWKEPKLLVIAELDEDGKQKRDQKPIYDATIGDAKKLHQILYQLCIQLKLHEAKEIVCLGDGADWIWNIFDRLVEELTIRDKTTQIVDWFHAVEHITELVEQHTGLDKKGKKLWAKQLREYLREGKLKQFQREVKHEAKKSNIKELKKELKYFEKRADRMKYNIYEANHQPIGSGSVESAIRRIINQRLKSPSSFWKPKNLEKMLILRCALKAGRWKILMNNFVETIRLKLPEE